jgi:hypothetical protein
VIAGDHRLGRRTATYKLALVLALLDRCARQSDEEGRAPTQLRTRDVAEKVASLYWPPVMLFRLEGSKVAPELRQITNKRSTIIDFDALDHGARSFGFFRVPAMNSSGCRRTSGRWNISFPVFTLPPR